MITQNPGKDFETVPRVLTGKSEITDVTTEDYRRGIILDSLEEISNALFVYDGGRVEGARATQDNLLDEVEKNHGVLGAGLLLLGGLKNARGFAQTLVKEALGDLQSRGRFSRHFDYDAIGTNFFKTTVEGERVGDKYVLRLLAAYVGDEPERKLAETLEKSMALIRSNALGKLSVIDGWWFNADMEHLLKGLPVSRQQISQLVQYIGSHDYMGEKPEVFFDHDGHAFNLSIGLDADRYLRPENGERGSEYLHARGYSIVGGAWTTWDETGNNKVAPRIVGPSLVLSVSFPEDRYSKPPVVDPEQMKLVQGARDYLGNLIRPTK